MKAVTFIACAYQEKHDAYQFISSLMLQTNPNWKCIIVVDGVNTWIRNALQHVTTRFIWEPDETRFQLIEYPIEREWNAWGHFNRIKALELVDTDYVVQTSIQDYYIPTTVDTILNKSADADFIYWDCIHNHFNYGVLRSEIRQGSIDWGSMAVKTKLAKEVGIQQPEHHCCDGIFAERCVEYLKSNSKYKAFDDYEIVDGLLYIPKILTVHN